MGNPHTPFPLLPRVPMGHSSSNSLSPSPCLLPSALSACFLLLYLLFQRVIFCCTGTSQSGPNCCHTPLPHPLLLSLPPLPCLVPARIMLRQCKYYCTKPMPQSSAHPNGLAVCLCVCAAVCTCGRGTWRVWIVKSLTATAADAAAARSEYVTIQSN